MHFSTRAGGPTHTGVARPDDGSGSVHNVQLGDDVGDVVAYGLAAHAQAVGDRSVVTPRGQQRQYLVLALGQLREWRLRGRPAEVTQHPRRDPGAEERLAACDCADRSDDLVRP